MKRLLPLLFCLLAPAGTLAEGRWYKPQYVKSGGAIYRQHCAVCHGVRAEGAPGWNLPGPDGKYPAPPLNGTGHTWHHPLKQLHKVIMDGGAGNMPAWRGTLNTAHVLAVLAWLQSHWGDDIYAAWQRIDKTPQAPG